MLGSKVLVPAFLALLIGGCPKRQTTPRIVYVQPPPAPPSSANQSTMSTPEILTIQEPELPPAADHSTPVASSSSTPAPQKGASPVNEPPPPAPAHETGEKAPVEPNPPTVAAEPSLRLEPEGGGQEEADLAARLNRMHSALESLGKWTNLNAEQQRTITDANTFYAQSSEALQQHDLLRAKQLADKADLLIKAILGQPK